MILPLYNSLAPLTLLRKFGPTEDPDAAAYLNAVEAADGQSLEPAVRVAVNTFVIGCKSDGIWSPIKASCILAGARTLLGALVPLVGAAPTNNNFVSGDYNRKTGLKGNATNKQINVNRLGSDDPQNNAHQAVWVAESPTTTTVRGYCGHNVSPASFLASTTGDLLQSRFRAGVTSTTSSAYSAGLKAQSRSQSTNYVMRSGGVNSTKTVTSSGNPAAAQFAFSRGSQTYSDARLSFYSLGESIDLALLDTRVSTLITDLAAAIP